MIPAHASLLAVPSRALLVAGMLVDDTHYLLRSAGLNGVSDSKVGIMSCWYVLDDDLGSQMLVGEDTAAFDIKVRFHRNSGANIANTVMFQNPADDVNLLAFGSPNNVISTAWRHWLCAWDMSDVNKCKFYLDEVAGSGGNPISNTDVDFTLPKWAVGNSPSGGIGGLIGKMAEVYFAPGQWLDLTVEANRRKFRTSDGRPAYLGPDGALPTGTAPAVYLTVPKGGVANDFQLNRGTGGDFAVQGGGLTLHTTTPSD